MVGFAQTDQGKPSEAAAALGEGAEWYESYFATLAPAERKKDAYMAKSNIDFAYALALQKLGQMDRAVIFQQRSLEARRTAFGPTDPDTVSATFQYAIALFKAGRKDEAEQTGRLAVQTAVDHVDPANPTYARSLEALGLILVRVGRRSESVDYFLRAAALKRKNGGTDINYLSAQSNLADSLLQLERYDEARVIGREAAEGFRAKEGDDGQKMLRALGYVGLAEAAQGDPGSAVEHLGHAFTKARIADAKEQFVGPLVLPMLIVSEVATGQRADALRHAAQYTADMRASTPNAFYLAYAELLERYVAPARDAAARSGAAARVITAIRSDRLLAASGELPQDRRAALDLVLRVAADVADAPLALDAMVVLAGSKLAQANRLVAERIAAADPALAALIRTRQDAAGDFRAADSAVLKAQVSGEGLVRAREQRAAAATVLAASEARLAAAYPRWVEASGAQLPDLAALQRGLQPHEAVLAVVPAFDGVYTLTITRTTALVRRTPLGRAAIFADVAALRASLPTRAFDTAAAHRLYQQFFPQADAALLRGVTSLRIVPSGALAALPFATLIERPVARSGARTPYLIRRFAIEISPGFAAPHSATAVNLASAGDGRFLGIGAPTPFGARDSIRHSGNDRIGDSRRGGALLSRRRGRSGGARRSARLARHAQRSGDRCAQLCAGPHPSPHRRCGKRSAAARHGPQDLFDDAVRHARAGQRRDGRRGRTRAGPRPARAGGSGRRSCSPHPK